MKFVIIFIATVAISRLSNSILVPTTDNTGPETIENAVDEPLGAIPVPTAEELAAFPPPPPGVSCVLPQVWWTTPAPGLCDCWNRKYASLCTYPGTWDKKSCYCRCSWWAYTLCSKNKYLDPRDCKCKCKDPPQCRECSFGQKYDNELCKCKCPQVLKCSSNRYFNQWTCQCECKQAPRSCCPELKPLKVWSEKTCNCECKYIKCCNTAAGYSWDPYLCKCVKIPKWWSMDFPTELARIQEDVEDLDVEGVVTCPEMRPPAPIETTPTPTEPTTLAPICIRIFDVFSDDQGQVFKKTGCLIVMPKNNVDAQRFCLSNGMHGLYTITDQKDWDYLLKALSENPEWRDKEFVMLIDGGFKNGRWVDSLFYDPALDLFPKAIPFGKSSAPENTKIAITGDGSNVYYTFDYNSDYLQAFWCQSINRIDVTSSTVPTQPSTGTTPNLSNCGDSFEVVGGYKWGCLVHVNEPAYAVEEACQGRGGMNIYSITNDNDYRSLINFANRRWPGADAGISMHVNGRYDSGKWLINATLGVYYGALPAEVPANSTRLNIQGNGASGFRFVAVPEDLQHFYWCEIRTPPY